MISSLVELWDKDKTYNKLSVTKLLGKTYLAVNRSDSENHSVFPMSLMTISNGVNSRSNSELILQLQSEMEFDNINSSDKETCHWIKL